MNGGGSDIDKAFEFNGFRGCLHGLGSSFGSRIT
jgi:hypothetical protein